VISPAIFCDQSRQINNYSRAGAAGAALINLRAPAVRYLSFHLLQTVLCLAGLSNKKRDSWCRRRRKRAEGKLTPAGAETSPLYFAAKGARVAPKDESHKATAEIETPHTSYGWFMQSLGLKIARLQGGRQILDLVKRVKYF